MRQFLEDDLRRAERQLREAERHVLRQKALVLRFEAVGEASKAQAARDRLPALEKSLELAKEALLRQRTGRRPTT